MSYEITYSRPSQAEDNEPVPVQHTVVSERQLKQIRKIPWINVHGVQRSKKKPCCLTLS